VRLECVKPVITAAAITGAFGGSAVPEGVSGGRTPTHPNGHAWTTA
jgi:hypothetical protein